ncbi:diacylglycerol kinase [Pseudogemmobacter humi]|uniref:Diacylglycerol kinase n=1 Tax=Pseudogemmobacter humi TaxID=2483812 RepID=A0A3P5XUZ2_9RHOB|nr:diacylglycerol kinase [Pseudogemmobacter humi]VDC32886.1 Diacylglycerol kinase [Pseudogemmobacter humi]
MPSSAPGGSPQKPPRTTGFAHFRDATRYSGAGLRRLLRESAFRQELIIGLLALAGLALWGADGAELAVFAVLLLILIAVEALNTAIETLVDHLSPGWSEFARDAKDLGSLAVAAVVAAMTLWLARVLFF